MKLEELLKESPEALKAVQDAIEKANEGQEDKTKHVRFADLSEGGYVSKDKYASLESSLTGKTSELETANALIEKLKSGTKTDEKLQAEIKDYKDQIAQLQAENAQNKLKYALKDALRNAKAVDADYLCYVLEKNAKDSGESIELDDDGNVKGWDDKLKELKVQCPNMFESGESNKHVHENKLPDQNHDGGTTEPKNLADAIRMKFEKKE